MLQKPGLISGLRDLTGKGQKETKLRRKLRAKNCKDNKSIPKDIPLTCREWVREHVALLIPQSEQPSQLLGGMRSRLTPTPGRMMRANSRCPRRRGYAYRKLAGQAAGVQGQAAAECWGKEARVHSGSQVKDAAVLSFSL